MQRVAKIVVGFIALAAGEQALSQNDLNDVVVADKIRTAFYVRAQRTIARAMRRGVANYCGTHASADLIDAAWLCHSSQLQFLRGILVTGYKDNDGFVCRAEFLGPTIRYIVPDIVIDNLHCAVALYDANSKSYEILR